MAGDIPQRRPRYLAGVALLLIVLVGLLLRVHRLGEQSVWYDEYISVSHVDDPDLWTCLRSQRPANWNMVPLYYALQYLWANTVSKSTVGVRLLSIVFGMLAVPLIYLLGRDLFGRQAGLVAALCLTLSSVHIYQAQEIRNYALTLLLALCSAYTLVKVLRDGRRRWWMLHVAANVLLVWTHLFGAFLLVAEGCFLIACRLRRRQTAAWFAANLILMVPSLFWIRTVPDQKPDAVDPFPAWAIVNNCIADCLPSPFWPKPPPGIVWQNPPPPWTRVFIDTYNIANLALLALFVFLAIHLAVRAFQTPRQGSGRENREPFVFLLCWLVIPPVTLWALGHVWRPDCMAPKYTTYCSLSMYLIAGGAVERFRAKAWRCLASGLLILLLGHRLVLALTETQRTDWQSAARVIHASSAPSDVIFSYGSVVEVVCAYNIRPLSTPVLKQTDLRELCRNTEAYLGEGRPVWVVALTFSRDVMDRFEKYLGLRRIHFTKNAYWAIQLPGILLYHIGPDSGFTRVDPDAAATVYRAVTEDYNAAQAFKRAGIAFHDQGRFGEAAAAFQRAFDLIPWDEEVYGLLANGLLYDTRDYAALAAAARKKIAARSDDAQAFGHLGQALIELGDPSGAIDACRKALAVDAAAPACCFKNLADLLIQRGDYEGAIATCGVGIRTHPMEEGLYSDQVNALYAKGDRDGAVNAFRQSLASLPRTDAVYDSLMSRCLDQDKDLDFAMALTQETLKAAPESARARECLADLLVRQGNAQRAIDVCTDLIEKSPHVQPAAFKALIVLLMKRGDYDAALPVLRRGIQHFPNDTFIQMNLAIALDEQGDLDGAVQAFRKMIALDPGSTAAYDSLGNLLFWKKKDYGAVVAVMRKAIAANPDFARGHALMGMALQNQGEKDAAIAAFKRSLELDPNGLPWSYGNLGTLLLERRDYDGAIAALRKGVELLSEDAFLHAKLGTALNATGDYDDAVVVLRKAVALNPSVSGTHLDLAQACLGKGDIPGAATSFRHAFKLDPGLKRACQETLVPRFGDAAREALRQSDLEAPVPGAS